MGLAEFISHTKSTTRIFPFDIIFFTADAAAATLDTTLVRDLYLPVGCHGIDAYRAKIQAAVPGTGFANLVRLNLKMRLFLINVIFERHEHVIHKCFRFKVSWMSFSLFIFTIL